MADYVRQEDEQAIIFIHFPYNATPVIICTDIAARCGELVPRACKPFLKSISRE